jgi:hypothetical protein
MADEYVVLPKDALFEFLGTLLPDANTSATANRIIEWVDKHDLSGVIESVTRRLDVNELPSANDNDLFSNIDALVWAERFVLRVSERPTIPTDVGTMLAWFAGAIMAGYDERSRRIISGNSYEDGWRDAMNQDNPPMSTASIETAET